MLKVGLTGGIGSGKTAVSDIFHSLGVRIIDTDIIAHELLSKDKNTKQEIINIFGSPILDSDNAIDRKILAETIFNDSANKNKLEKILHPKIRQNVIQQIERAQAETNSEDKKYLIIVVPLLLETDFHELVDQILVVTADEDIRLKRIQQRDNRTIEEIHSIMTHQIDEEKRLSMADDIIQNGDRIDNLLLQIENLDNKYTSLSKAI